MKGLALIALVLILLSAQSACGEEGLMVKNVEIYTIIPLDINYPLFEYGSCKTLTFDDGHVGSVFKFNNTSKNEIFGRLESDNRVTTPTDNNNSIQFEITNHPNYYIFLLSDMLVIRHTIRSDEWLNDSEYWSEKNDVGDVVKENFFGDSPILPRLDGVRPLDKNKWYFKEFTVVMVNQDSTKPRINDTNLESYARFLLLPQSKSIKIERTGAGKFIAYHKGKEVALIPTNSLVHPDHAWDFLPFIELTEIIIPISEERIKIVESGIDDSSVIMGRNLADLIHGKCVEIPKRPPAEDYRKDIDNLTDLKKKEQEALLNSNMNILVDIFEEFGRGRSVDYWKGSLTDDINELNRKTDRLDDQYYIILNYETLQKQIETAWFGIKLALGVALISIIASLLSIIVSIYYNHKQIKYVKDAAKKQTEQLDNIRKVLIKFHRIIILHKRK